MLTHLIDSFPRLRVLVIGDVILDHYVRGTVARTSPEAPVPILHVQREEFLPGGAANVARNLTALGARVDLLGLVGRDEAAGHLRTSLEQTAGLKPHLLTEAGRPTILKTRCVAQGQQMLRLDREETHPASDATCAAALARVEKLLTKCHGIILSDYGKGFLRPDFLQAVIARAREAGVRVVVDPKGRDYARYRGVTTLTPNQKEASEASGVTITDDASVAEAARRLQKTIAGEAVVITRGAAGVSVFPRRGRASHLPAQAREVFDVTGAGDTFIAVFTLGLLAGGSWAGAAELGNLAAGIKVGRAGVATVSAEELRRASEGGRARAGKLLAGEELLQACRSVQLHGGRVVFTNGFFDLLHHGHIRLLEQARVQGDCLVVALNSDASVQRLKGAPRPLLKFSERAAVLAALPFVDFLTMQEEDTPEELLRRLRPDVLVKGAKTEHVVGREIVEGYGGQVKFVEVEDQAASISSILARATPADAAPSRRKGGKR